MVNVGKYTGHRCHGIGIISNPLWFFSSCHMCHKWQEPGVFLCKTGHCIFWSETIVAMVSNTVPRPLKGVKFQPQTVCFWWLNGTNLEDSGMCFFHPDMWRRILLVYDSYFSERGWFNHLSKRSYQQYPPREDKEKHRPKNHQFFFWGGVQNASFRVCICIINDIYIRYTYISRYF